MEKIKKGDIVNLKDSKDRIIYSVSELIENDKKAVLKGITQRLEKICIVEKLEVPDVSKLNEVLRQFEESINLGIEELNIKNKERKIDIRNEENKDNRLQELSKEAKILHLDGDKKYADKSNRVYSKLGLNAVVKNVKENQQPSIIIGLLEKYNPDIVIITGHDGIIKKGSFYNDISNYRNSKYFVNTVLEIRKWEQGRNNISVFAGACQSFYEAIIEAGANFASSPARILIDFMDPLIIAQKIAITPEEKYITINQIRDELRNGERGISGVGSFGKLR